MPKLEAESLTQKIGLDQIIDNGNIREKEKYGPNEKGDYPAEIMELAESIKSIGQLQPINVKLIGEVDGTKQFELIAGGRRRAAFQYLCSIGEDFSRIDAKITTGNKLTIQLVENIQREDLSASEREAAIFQLAESGLKQSEIAAQLSKPKAYVSIHISAFEMRQQAEKAEIDTSGIETSTFSELLSIPENDLIKVITDLVNFGGTRSIAKQLAKQYKKPAAPPDEKPETPPEENIADIDPLAGENTLPGASPEPPPITPDENPPPVTPEKRRPLLGTKEEEPIEAAHRVVDVNIILTIIFNYINKTAGERKEAAKDILAIIHKELDKNHA